MGHDAALARHRVTDSSRRRREGDAREPSLAVVMACVAVAAIFAAISVSHDLGNISFERDESASYLIAAMPWSDFLMEITGQNFNSGLYYFLLRGVVPFSVSEWALRLPSAIAFVALVPAAAALASRLLGRRQAIAVAALVASQPYLTEYGQVARGYALLLLLSLAAWWLLDVGVTEGRRSAWLLYGLAVGVGIYVHLFIVFLVVAHAVGVIAVRRRLDIGAALWGVALAALLWTPMCLIVMSERAEQVSYFETPPLLQPIHTVIEFVGSVPMMVALGSAAMLSLIRWLPRWSTVARDFGPWRRYALATGAILPITVLWLLSYVIPSYNSYYVIYCLPPMLLLAADGLSTIADRRLWTAALVGLLLLTAVPLVRYHTTTIRTEDIRAAAAYVGERGDGEDAVVFLPAHARIGFRYYRMRDPRDDVPEDIAQVDDRSPALWREELSPDQLWTKLRERRDVWVVTYPGDTWYPSPPVMEAVAADCLPTLFRQVDVANFKEMQVVRYTRRSAPTAATCRLADSRVAADALGATRD